MKNFEDRLERLEILGEKIRKPDMPLNDALKAFEEGIKLARSLEKDLEKVESRIEILLNGTGTLAGGGGEEEADLGLFDTEEYQ
ncbi:MAG: exodeoxyribonuclease VII small subunit [Treponema sp.]|nr:exodeoxyribonuclease VII small subunit [Treponema sp.]